MYTYFYLIHWESPLFRESSPDVCWEYAIYLRILALGATARGYGLKRDVNFSDVVGSIPR